MAEELTDDLTEVRKYTGEVHRVYAAIARRIEELIELLNNPSANQDKIIEQLAGRILTFLNEIKDFVKKEKKIARKKRWSGRKKNTFLALIQTELQDINKLIKDLKVERKRPNHELVTSIYNLTRDITKIMAAEEAELEP